MKIPSTLSPPLAAIVAFALVCASVQPAAAAGAGGAVDAYLAAYRSGDMERLARLYTPDTVFVDVSQRHERRGQQEMRQGLLAIAAMHESMGIEEKRRAVDGDLVVVEVVYTGTLDGAALGLPAGEPLTYSLPAVLLFEVEDGLIRRQTDYLDFRTLSELRASVQAPQPAAGSH